ncbi:MAG: alpha/beta fold hydrolase [Actinomycetota bacterium]
MSLHVETRGTGVRLVLAHGFTQNADCWGPFADDLAADHELALVDLPGHGQTASLHDDADLPVAGDLLADSGGEAVYVGYSMGGRVALHTAMAAPEQVRALVLIASTAGIDHPNERAQRRRADEALADRILDGGDAGLPAFIDQWLTSPLFAGLGPEAAARAARLTNRASGLAASLVNCGTGTQEPLWEQLHQLTMPVLVMVGSDDAKFTAIGERLVAALPTAELRSLPATHAAHLECPTRAADIIRRFVARLDPVSG